jgi:hypothetical protein
MAFFGDQFSELPDDKALFQGCEDWIYGRWLDEVSGLPLCDPDLAN